MTLAICFGEIMPKKQPRYYQTDAITALMRGLKDKSAVPYANLSTGSGKSLVSAHIMNLGLNNNRRVLMLVPSKELCEQNYKEAFEYCDSPGDIGICCSQLGKFNTHKKGVIATASSFLSRRAKSGRYDLVIIDECHRFGPSKDATYWKIIDSLYRLNPDMRIVGMTATPYRMDMGMLHDALPKHKGEAIFTECVYESDIKQLIAEGYLSHVKDISGEIHADLSGVPIAGKDYDAKKMGVKFDEIVCDAVLDMKAKFAANDIKTALVFASTVENAQRILEEWNDPNTMRIVTGEMAKHDRELAIKWLKSAPGCRYIVNVGILTTGFDFTALDCVVLMRATKSTGLYIQMVGRVIRAHSDKEMGYLIDYGTNVERHGPIDDIQVKKKSFRDGPTPMRQCKACEGYSILQATACEHCGELFPVNPMGDYSMRSDAQVVAEIVRYDVDRVTFQLDYSRKDLTKMIKMRFLDEDDKIIHSHFLCLNHDGFARKNSEKMLFSMMRDPMFYWKTLEAMDGGANVDNVMLSLDEYDDYYKEFKTITVVPDGKYKKLLAWEFK